MKCFSEFNKTPPRPPPAPWLSPQQPLHWSPLDQFHHQWHHRQSGLDNVSRTDYIWCLAEFKFFVPFADWNQNHPEFEFNLMSAVLTSQKRSISSTRPFHQCSFWLKESWSHSSNTPVVQKYLHFQQQSVYFTVRECTVVLSHVSKGALVRRKHNYKNASSAFSFSAFACKQCKQIQAAWSKVARSDAPQEVTESTLIDRHQNLSEFACSPFEILKRSFGQEPSRQRTVRINRGVVVNVLHTRLTISPKRILPMPIFFNNVSSVLWKYELLLLQKEAGEC